MHKETIHKSLSVPTQRESVVSHAAVLHKLAQNYALSGDHFTAELLFLECLQLRELMFGTRSLAVADLFLELGKLYECTGRGAYSSSLKQRAEIIFSELSGTFRRPLAGSLP